MSHKSKYEAHWAAYIESDEWPADLPLPLKTGKGQTGYGGVHPIPGRRFEPDFVWPDLKVCLEVLGGFWSKGGHENLGNPFITYEKYNLMQLHGWLIIFAPAPQHLDERVVKHLHRALSLRRASS